MATKFTQLFKCVTRLAGVTLVTASVNNKRSDQSMPTVQDAKRRPYCQWETNSHNLHCYMARYSVKNIELLFRHLNATDRRAMIKILECLQLAEETGKQNYLIEDVNGENERIMVCPNGETFHLHSPN